MKTKTTMALLFLLATGLTLFATACDDGGGNNGDDPIKAAWIYISPVGDMGWTYMHNQGRLAVDAQFGDDVETSFVDNVAETDEAVEAVIDDLVAQDHDIIFTTSFGYMSGTKAAAEKYPDVLFEHCSGYEQGTNLANYFGRIYQSRFLTGMVAGRMTESNKIGYVAAFPIPEVIRGINAFTLGVRSVNPDAQVLVDWTFTWYEPTTEGQTANGLLDQGCDVMAQHQDSTATVSAAQARGAYAVGYDSDMLASAPDTVLTSAIWNWGSYYVDRIQAVIDGNWSAHSYWGTMADGLVDIGSYGDMVPAAVQTEVADKKAEIVAGTFTVFAGPINKQDGSVWLSDGETLSDNELLGQMEFVEGVVGTIPEE